jgi:2-polyprenyl-3-methyl-5-hydroxy-6-metoxy-1,4-benzoquinol methylase
MLAELDRIEAERIHHDEQAAERARYFASNRFDLCFSDEFYLEHAPWIRPAIANLGSVQNKAILDYGCGHGMASVVLARQGAIVTGFDLAPNYVAEARLRASINHVSATFVTANAEELPFEDASFDAVWGAAILHHLDLERAGSELKRILKPGGVAVFCEPWGENPIVNFVRDWVPYPGKSRTRDEKPFRFADLKPLQVYFPDLQIQGFQLLGMANRLFYRQPKGNSLLDRIDARLIRTIPSLHRFGRYVVLKMSKLH